MISIYYYYALIGFIPGLLLSLFAANDFRYTWDRFLDVDVTFGSIIAFAFYWAIWPAVTVIWLYVSGIYLILEHDIFRRTLFNPQNIIDYITDYFKKKKGTEVE